METASVVDHNSQLVAHDVLFFKDVHRSEHDAVMGTKKAAGGCGNSVLGGLFVNLDEEIDAPMPQTRPTRVQRRAKRRNEGIAA